MKKIILCLLAALCADASCACDVSSEVLLKDLSAELARNYKALKKQKPPVYYLSYSVWREQSFAARAQLGSLAFAREEESATGEVMARVGSPRMDNTRELKGMRADMGLDVISLPLEIKPGSLALRNAFWRLTRRAVEKARQNFNTVQANAAVSSSNTDTSDDFTFPPKSTYCGASRPLAYDRAEVEARLVRLSSLVKGHAFVLNSDFSFSIGREDKYFTDSVGSRIKTSRVLGRYAFSVAGKNADGMEIERLVSYDGEKMEDFPSEDVMERDVKAALEELRTLKNAPVLDPVTVPAILKNRAAGVFFHEVMGHRLEGHRQKSESFGQTFTKKMGQLITSPIITVVEDPTEEYFDGIPLRGAYKYDDEGVKARPVTLVEKGVLKNFMMSSSPVNGFPASNGHGRKESGRRAVARMGNLFVRPETAVPYEELEKQLLEEIRRQGKPYGLIIEDLTGGYTLTETSLPQTFKLNTQLVYRLWPDGRKEAVRGVSLVGTPLVSFGKIIGAADDYAVFNGSCGAESGWVPQANIAPSLLFSAVEMERVEKSPAKPPVLPAPYASEDGGKKK